MNKLLLLARRPRRRRPPLPPSQPPLRAIADQVSEQALRATVERLVGFGTRHTLSVRDNPTRGIGAALNWTEAEFRRISRGLRRLPDDRAALRHGHQPAHPDADPGRGRGRDPARHERSRTA